MILSVKSLSENFQKITLLIFFSFFLDTFSIDTLVDAVIVIDTIREINNDMIKDSIFF